MLIMLSNTWTLSKKEYIWSIFVTNHIEVVDENPLLDFKLYFVLKKKAVKFLDRISFPRPASLSPKSICRGNVSMKMAVSRP